MRTLLFVLALFLSSFGLAWDGYDLGMGSYVEIEKGNTVRTGREIEYYDYGTGEYRTGTVESIQRYGGSVEIEVTDDTTGELRTFDMDDD